METRWVEYIIAIITGLATTIPLVIKLVEYVRKETKARNWGALLNLVMAYMSEAELLFDNGADRKEWVMKMIAASANTIEYDVDMNAVSYLIDGLCGMAKVVNNSEAQE